MWKDHSRQKLKPEALAVNRVLLFISQTRRIDNASMKALLSSTSTLDELSVNLSTNLIEYVKDTDTIYVP